MKRTSKIIMVLAVLLVSTTLVSAALLTYFGQVQTTANVQQSVVISDGTGWKNYNEPIVREFVVTGGSCKSFNHWIKNRAEVPATVNLETTFNDPDGVTVSSLIDYSFSKNIMGVGVTVTDTGDGFLKWTYTYAATPTHTPKMTVAINYPTGFAITTFDDGSHTGWWYAPDGGTAVQLTGSETWVQAGATGNNVLWVKIQKSSLGNAFHWHGFANLDGTGVWIDQTGTSTSYGVPPFEAALVLTSPFTLQPGQELPFVIKYCFAINIIPGQYIITTKFVPQP
jgi:hypothetical protein